MGTSTNSIPNETKCCRNKDVNASKDESLWRRNTPDEMIEIITAHKQGKPLEGRSELSAGWRSAAWPTFDFCTYQYRVKKEPQEIWLRGNNVFYTEEAAKGWFAGGSDKIVRFREVIEE